MLPRLSVSTFSVASSSDVHVCVSQVCPSPRATLCLKAWRSLKRSSGSFIRHVISIPPCTGWFKCSHLCLCCKADHKHPTRFILTLPLVRLLVLLYNAQRSVEPPALGVYRFTLSEHTLHTNACVGFSAL